MTICFGCNIEMHGWQSTQMYCPTCMNRRSLEKQTELMEENALTQARMQAEQMERSEQQSRENARLARETADYNAELDRKQAKENARLAAESGVSYDDAYTYGLNYLASGETAYLRRNLSEDGVITARPEVYSKPYKMVHLNQAFDRGVKESAKDIVSPGLDYMKERAFEAGVKTQDSFTITCNTDSNITNRYRSNMKRHINIDTGEVSYHWDNPFTSDVLNDVYAEGVDFFIQEENANTPEKIAARMKNEVAVMRAERDAQNVRLEEERVAAEHALIAKRADWEANRIRIIKEADQLAVICVVGILILLAAVVFLWNANHGFIAFLVAIGLVVVGGLIGYGYDDTFGRANELKRDSKCPY
jgi:hypothetical protein